MSYFRELPDLEYQSPLLHKRSSKEFVRVKNLFRRVKLLDWLQDKATLFNKYQILEGERPDTVAEKIYGRSDYDWVVLLTANIINVRDRWPLSNKDLYTFVENKYGAAKINDIHHYETIEVKDSKGRLVLLKNQIVDSNFTITVPYNETYTGLRTYGNITFAPDTTGNISPIIGISNYEYEVEKNEDKRQIYILKSF